ncbi:MAG: metallophosphoesterase [Cocleimonas sp.]|nr:metallophosphoesterase [Cocleimonas sp.]
MQNFLFKYFPTNHLGRDFVVGDIHGMFDSLEELLEKISFNPKRDRVFSVGDLIDRGAQSYRVVEFLDKPWFFSVMGNHESMLLDAKISDYNLHNWIKYNGGGWWKKLSKQAQDETYQKISKLPYLFEIETAIGKVGVAHADLPAARSWVDIVKSISTDYDLKHYILWSRQRHRNMRITNKTVPIKGVKLVVMGHTPYKEPLYRGNVFYIDTGAAYQQDESLASLTLLQIHPRLKTHQYSTCKDLQSVP